MLSGFLSTVLCLATVFSASSKGDSAQSVPVPKVALSGAERLGQLMLVTLQGLYAPSNDDRVLLKNFTPGGVIIPLAQEPSQAVQYVEDLQGNSLERTKGVPLLLGADIYSLTHHDSRIKSAFIQIPSILGISASGSVSAAERLAGLISDHLTMMGFNFNIGPCLELAPTLPGAPMNLNTFGSDATFAGSAGCAMLRVFQERGIVAMPLGFPGGGANRQGKGAASLLTPKNQLDHQDLLPFHQAIEQGLPILNVGNTLAPGLDEQVIPSSLSGKVMADLLRKEWGYQGVIVAGPMDAPEIKELYDPADASVLALQAGADMLYWAQPGEQVRKAMERISRALEDGTLSNELIDAKLARILEMKAHSIKATAAPKAREADKLVTKGKYLDAAADIERQSITLVKNENNALPLIKDRSLPVGITGVVGVSELREELQKYIKPVLEQQIRTAAHLGDIEDFEINRLTSGSGMRTAICVFKDMPRMQGQMRLISELKKSGMTVVVVALGDPRNLVHYAAADAVVAAYCEGGQYDASIRAVASILAGYAPVRVLESKRTLEIGAGKATNFDAGKVVRGPIGRLPIAVGDTLVVGTGCSYAPEFLLKKAEWDFGDGIREKGIQLEHTYQSPGNYALALTVTTPDGDQATGTFSVKVK